MYYGGLNSSSSRTEDKEELRKCNDRLANYIQNVRAKAKAQGLDSPHFLNEFRSLEEAAKNLNDMYLREMEDLRRELEAEKREKNANRTEADRNKRIADDLEDKLRAEQGKSNQLMAENGELCRRVAQLERELNETRQAARGPQNKAQQLESEVNNMKGRNNEMERKLGEEMVLRKQAEDKVNQLQKKLDFNDQLHKEQMKDAADRLEQATKALNDLENQCRDLEQQGATYPELIDKMRADLDQQMQAYKNDVEDLHRKNMNDMKGRLDAQDGTIAELRNANNRLQADNDKLQDKIRELDGKLRDATKEKAAHEELLNKERKRGADQVRANEKKLKDLQDELYQKMQESNMNKDDNVNLKMEIETYKRILAEEEKRLKSQGGSQPGGPYTSMNRPQVSSSYRPSDRLGKVSNANLNDKRSYMFSGNDLEQGRQESRMGSQGGMGYNNDTKGMNDGRYTNRDDGRHTEYQDEYIPRVPYTHRGDMKSSLDEHNRAFQMSRSQTMTGLPKIGSRQGDIRGSGNYANAPSGNIRYGQVY